jgi:hypothetical protein
MGVVLPGTTLKIEYKAMDAPVYTSDPVGYVKSRLAKMT